MPEVEEGRPLTDLEIRDLEERVGIPPNYHLLSRGEREVWVLRHSCSPVMTLKRVAQRLGLKEEACVQRWRRGKKRLEGAPDTGLIPRASDAVVQSSSGAIGARGELNVADLVRTIEQKIWQTTQAMDGKRFEGASYQHLAKGLRDLTEVRAVLRGEPSKIIRHEDDRETLGRVMEMLQKEMERRNLKGRYDEATSGTVIEHISSSVSES